MSPHVVGGTITVLTISSIISQHHIITLKKLWEQRVTTDDCVSENVFVFLWVKCDSEMLVMRRMINILIFCVHQQRPGGAWRHVRLLPVKSEMIKESE